MQSEPPQADPPNRKRRWFQFSLRTLMIGVTIFCVVMGGYAAREAKIVRERRAWGATDGNAAGLFVRSSVRENQAWEAATYKSHFIFSHPREFAHGDASQSPSLIRRWMGDETQEMVVVGIADSVSEKQAAAELFPEATVYELPPMQ